MANLNRLTLIREGDMMDKGVLGRCSCLFQLLKKMLNLINGIQEKLNETNFEILTKPNFRKISLCIKFLSVIK